MATTVNEATGEVSVELGGKTFRLRATMPRVAEFEATLGVDGLAGIQKCLQDSKTNAVYQGLRCLCVSGNEADLEELLLTPNLGEATSAIYKALTAGLPQEPARGNARATTATKTRAPRGRDTASLPSV